MIFLTILIALVVMFIVLAILADKLDWRGDFCYEGGFSILAVVVGFVLMIALVVVIINHANPEGKLAAYEEKYESLQYQVTNDIYDNDNDIGKKELYDEVTKWNANLAAGKCGLHNKWWSVFYQPVWDKLEPISFPQVNNDGR